jgi:hypothetical protein
METAIQFDWSSNWSDDGREKYRNLGREVLLDSCNHKPHASENDYCEECGISEDSAVPMMNYLYPVYNRYGGYSDARILKVVKETNCTLVEDNESGELFLTLCAGGMDLSQDIALAYYLLGDGPYNMIPVDVLRSMCLQPELSIGLKEFVTVTRQGIKEIKNDISNLQWKLKEMKQANKRARESLKAKRDKNGRNK